MRCYFPFLVYIIFLSFFVWKCIVIIFCRFFVDFVSYCRLLYVVLSIIFVCMCFIWILSWSKLDYYYYYMEKCSVKAHEYNVHNFWSWNAYVKKSTQFSLIIWKNYLEYTLCLLFYNPYDLKSNHTYGWLLIVLLVM